MHVRILVLQLPYILIEICHPHKSFEISNRNDLKVRTTERPKPSLQRSFETAIPRREKFDYQKIDSRRRRSRRAIRRFVTSSLILSRGTSNITKLTQNYRKNEYLS